MLLLSPENNNRDVETSWRVPSSAIVAFGAALRLGDLAVLVAAGALAYRLRFGAELLRPEYLSTLLNGTLLALLVFNLSPLYRGWRGRRPGAELLTLATQWSLLFLLTLLSTVVLKTTGELSRVWLGLWFAAGLGGAVLLRAAIRGLGYWFLSQGVDTRSAVVVGANPDSQRLVDAIHGNPWNGVAVRGWFATHADRSRLEGVPLLGALEGLGAYVESHPVDQVWITLPMSEQRWISDALAQLRHSTADVKFVPDLYGMHLLNKSVEEVAGLPVINLQQSPLQGPAALVKLLEDRLLALAILLMIAPLMLAIALAVRLSSPGPVFYRQERVSWNNRRFQMLKFRSLPVDAESATGAVWAKPGELRATRVGAFLRKTSLDELPQFINVLRGEMSIVGPRPERPVFVEQFKHQIPSYMKKHMVKAGITGWAQINGWRGSTDLGKRVECDIHYIENWSLWFDLKIIFLTLFKGFVHKNAY